MGLSVEPLISTLKGKPKKGHIHHRCLRTQAPLELRYWADLGPELPRSFDNLFFLTLHEGTRWHRTCCTELRMLRFFRTRKILIHDIPPPSNGMRDDLAIIVIGILCAVAAVAAMVFVFLGV
jgi:hypothetical protein